MKRISDIKIFANSHMNLDDDSRYLKENEHREIWNSMISVGEGSVGRLNKHIGTTNAFTLPINSGFTLPTGDFTCIGAEEDTKDNAIIYMLCDTSSSHNHSIMRMFIDNYRLEWILKSEPLLNFQPDYLITDIWRLGDLLGWTDNYEGTPFVDYNPPREINIVRALGYTNYYDPNKLYKTGEYAGYNGKVYRYIYPTISTVGILPVPSIYWELADVGIYTTITSAIISRIKNPPVVNMSVSYDDDTSYNVNNLRGNLWQFRYRYVYLDNECSVWSVISGIPLPQLDEVGGGTYEPPATLNNRLSCWVYTGGDQIKKIEVAVRSGNSGIWTLIERINKYDTDGTRLVTDNINVQFYFYNNVRGEGLDQADVEKLYDAVPQISAHEKLIEKNRIIDGDYIEGHDPVEIDVDLTATSQILNLMSNVPVVFDYYTQNEYSGGVALTEMWTWFKLYNPLPSDMVFYCLVWRYYWAGDDLFVQPLPFNRPYTTGCEFYPIYLRPQEGETFTLFMDRLATTIQSETSINTQIWIPNSPGTIRMSMTIVYDVDDGPGDPYIGAYVPAAVRCGWMPAIQKIPGFKSGATHPFGLIYYDEALRNGSVLTCNESSIYIPYPTEGTIVPFLQQLNIHHISWAINNRPPEWARYYQWVYAKSNVEWFLDFGVPMSAFEESSSPPAVFVDLNEAILDMKEMMPQSVIQNYDWQEGDRFRVLSASVSDNYTYQALVTKHIDVEILGTIYRTGDGSFKYDDANTPVVITDSDGNKVKDLKSLRLQLPSFSLSDLGIDDSDESRMVVIEVYRPRKRTLDDSVQLYYEIDGLYDILDPHTSSRRHQGGDGGSNQNVNLTIPATGIFNYGGTPSTYYTSSDIYVKLRMSKLNLVPIEAMEFNDTSPTVVSSIGRPQVVLSTMKRTRYISNLLYSGMYIENTLTNELSKVRSSDKVELAEKYGEINSIEEVGYTLKVLQKYKPTSLYIGREGLKQANIGGQDVVASSDAVLSKANETESDYGTSHPGSVCKFERQLYFYDIYSGDILRDAGNGIQSLSKDYKIDAFIKAKSILFLQSGVDNVKVTSCYDHKNNVMFMTFIDSITPVNSFTIGFRNSQRQEEEGFISFYQFKPDYYGVLKQCMTAFKNEVLWIHNLGDTCNFYGTKYIASVKIVSNKEPITVKRFLTIAQSGNKVWDSPTEGDIIIPITDTYQRGASSLLKAARYVKREGKFVSDFMKNMVTTSVTPKVSELITGDDLRGQVLEMTLYNNDDGSVELFAIEINSVESK